MKFPWAVHDQQLAVATAAKRRPCEPAAGLLLVSWGAAAANVAQRHVL